MRTYLHL